MKGRRGLDNLTAAVCLCLTVLVAHGAAHASLLESHFGVTPTLTYISNWQYASGQYYSGYQFNTGSLAPTKNLHSVDYRVNDWFGQWDNTSVMGHTDYPGTGTYPSGAEPYDVEAMYFDDDGRNLYISIITSLRSPTTGIFVETRQGLNIPVTQGDLAIDLGLTGSQQDTRGFRYNYGLDLVDENRPNSGNVTTFATNTVGNTLYRTTGNGSTGAWYLGTPNGAVTPPGDSANTSFDPSARPTYVANVGTATTTWTQLNLYYGGNQVQENNYSTWLVEAVVPETLFGRLTPGQRISFQLLPGCRNDGNGTDLYMWLDGTLNTPEPSTWVLMGLGVVALGWRLRRGRASRSSGP
jgi:hypothetical protein